MKRLLVVVISFLLLTGSIWAMESQKADSLILNGKVMIQKAVDAWNLQQMLGARGYFERLLNSDADAGRIHYYLGYIDWRITGYFFSSGKTKEALPYIDDGIVHLEKSVENTPDFAEALALHSSLLGNKIGVKPLLGMTLGMKSGALMGKAQALDPDNPRILFLSGQSDFYTPKMFGGSKKRALEKFGLSVERFKEYETAGETDPDWGEEDAMIYLGIALMDQNDLEGAKVQFEAILERNPEHGWVKYALMPELEKKMNEME